jgi:hypothetical protein
MRKLLLSLFLSAVFFACDDNEAPENHAVVLTVIVDPDFEPAPEITGLIGNWIMIHDKDGMLAASKTFSNGETIVFDEGTTGPLGHFSVTRCRVAKIDNQIVTSFETTTKVEPGGEYRLRHGAYEAETLTPIGEAPFSFEHSDAPASATETALGNTQFFSMAPSGGTSLNTNLALFEEQNDYLLTTYTSAGVPKYKYLDNLQPGNYSYTLADLSNFDNTYTYTFPPAVNTNLFISASTEEAADDMNFITNMFVEYGVERSSLKVGTLNRFDIYRVWMSLDAADCNYTFLSGGALPSALNLPKDLQIDIVNGSYGDFEWTCNETFERSVEQWVNPNPNINLTWHIAKDPSGYQNPMNLPSDFMTALPEFHFGDLERVNLKIVKSTVPYSDYVAQAFKGKAAEMEYMEITKTFPAE